MASLTIDYNPDTRSAVLSMDEGEGWAQIIRVCEDHSDQLRILSATSLELPWWSFLSMRERLRYYIKRYSIALIVSEKAKSLLEQSRERDRLYERRTCLLELTEDEIIKRLTEKGFERTLTKEQLRNVKKLICFPAGATFSVPGSGKTTEVLAYFVLLKSANDRLLVVCPKNAFPAWEQEIQECLPNVPLAISRLTGGGQQISQSLENPLDISLITYQQVPYVRDTIANYLLRFHVFLYLDESHRIKGGVDRVIAKAILSVSHLAYRKIVMSGTPMPNSTDDLIPQFSFLYPEIDVDETNVTDLYRPVFVRTTKNELGLPKIKKIAVPILMNEGQRLFYNLLASEVARQNTNQLSSFDKNQLRRIGRSALTLLQLTSNPTLLVRRRLPYNDFLKSVLSEGDSPKIKYLTVKARQLARKGQKVIIWSSFVSNVELIAERLADLGAEYIHGGVEAGSEEEESTREAKIKRFHDDPQCCVLVANPAACGEGISLHKVCRNAIYLDRTYNVAQYLQSEDRIHRLGLPKDAQINVEILMCPGTVDESVNRRLLMKIKKMEDFLKDRDITVSPIPFDPDEDDSLDYEDVMDFIDHVRIASGVSANA